MRRVVLLDVAMKLGTAEVIHGDALDLARVPDRSVSLIVTSPPYDDARGYLDGGTVYDGQIGNEDSVDAYLDHLWRAVASWLPKLRPDGSIFVNLDDGYAGGYGHGNAGLPGAIVTPPPTKALAGNGHGTQTGRSHDVGKVRRKSLKGVPWRFIIGCIDGRSGVGPDGTEWTLPPFIVRAEITARSRNGGSSSPGTTSPSSNGPTAPPRRKSRSGDGATTQRACSRSTCS